MTDKLKRLFDDLVDERVRSPAPSPGSVADIWYCHIIAKIDRLLAEPEAQLGVLPSVDADGSEVLKVVCRAEKAEAELAAERERFNLLSQRCAQAEADRDAARTSFAELVRRVQLETGTFAQWREVDADEVADVMDVVADDHNKMLGALLVLRRLVVGEKLYWEQRREDQGGKQ